MNKNNSNTGRRTGSAKKTSAASASVHPINHALVHVQLRSNTLKRTLVTQPDKSIKRSAIVSTPAERYLDSLRTPSVSNGQGQSHLTIPKSTSIKHFSPSLYATSQPPQAYVTPKIIEPRQPKSHVEVLIDRAMNKEIPEQPAPSKPHSKLFRFSLVAVPILVIGLFVYGVANISTLELKVASAKAGFNTTVPSYRPAGYSLNQISYKTGIFASEYNNSAGSYIITQKSTSWNTQSLLNNYISVLMTHYSEVHVGNKTIYLYGDGNATWVQNGIWYQINTDGLLNETQLIDIANSL